MLESSPAKVRHLHALPAGDGNPPSEAALVRAAQRPGDRHDAWPVNGLGEQLLDEIYAQAARLRVSVELAVSLVVQRLVAIDDLHAVFGFETPRLMAALDQAAADATVQRAVSPAYASYVRELTASGSWRSAAFATVPLPVRVIERLGGSTPATDATAVDVAAAVAWERAAALTGQTMAEWAALSVARLSFA
jgi:hypothetical protein